MISLEVRGIPCVMDDEPLDNIEVLETIAEIEGGNILCIPRFFKAVFGDEQYENIKRSLRDERGVCHASDLLDFYHECLDEAAKTKKAEAKN